MTMTAKPLPLAPLHPLARKALCLSSRVKIIPVPGAENLFAVQVVAKDGRPGLLFGADGLLWVFESAGYAQACVYHAHDAANILPEDRVC